MWWPPLGERPAVIGLGCQSTHSLAFCLLLGGSLLDKISRRSRWLNIWSMLAWISFSTTAQKRKKNNYWKNNKYSHLPYPFRSTVKMTSFPFLIVYQWDCWEGKQSQRIIAGIIIIIVNLNWNKSNISFFYIKWTKKYVFQKEKNAYTNDDGEKNSNYTKWL